jgi:hypothetical protein
MLFHPSSIVEFLPVKQNYPDATSGDGAVSQFKELDVISN